jgi:hypothetical protein
LREEKNSIRILPSLLQIRTLIIVSLQWHLLNEVTLVLQFLQTVLQDQRTLRWPELCNYTSAPALIQNQITVYSFLLLQIFRLKHVFQSLPTLVLP